MLGERKPPLLLQCSRVRMNVRQLCSQWSSLLFVALNPSGLQSAVVYDVFDAASSNLRL